MSAVVELFLIGFTAFLGPCAVYCLPIIYPYIGATRNNWINAIEGIIFFSFTRFFVHLFLGLLATVFGRFLIISFSKFSKFFYLFFGLIVLISGISILLRRRHFFAFFLPKMNLRGKNRDLLVFGVLMALYPCAPRLGVLAYIAMEAKNIVTGLIYAFAFGLGEFISPILMFGILFTLIPKYLFRETVKVSRNLTDKLCIVFNYFCAFLLIFLGLRLLSKFF